ncbi:MAG: putative lipid II flippase FtsW [Spirochaetaceae bacterium]|jgi:cell division protein FtsW|nr:putative lipid II flippase FtsW [Spirochaetaceae bacterium]
MYGFNVEKAGNRFQGDHILGASIFFLLGLGAVTLYSSSYVYAERFFGNGLYLISRQIVFLCLGLFLFFIISRINLDAARRWSLPGVFVVGTAFLCVLPLLPVVGVTRNGASRWFRIGSETFQPSELVKLVLPLYLAHIFDKKQDQINSLVKGILPPAFVTGVFIVLIALQNNFSTAAFIATNAIFVFYLAGVKRRYFLSGLFIFLPFAVLLVLTKEHRFRRLISYLNPNWDPHGAGYQVRASIMTIASGGFWGKGVGHGVRKVSSVPEIQSDFIFSAFAEEAGFLGILLFFSLFAVFVIRGYRASLRAEDLYRKLLAFGLVTEIFSQTLINIAVVSGSVPATGIPLPFFSAGGSSLLTTLIASGIIVNISRSRGETGTFGSEDAPFPRRPDPWYDPEV